MFLPHQVGHQNTPYICSWSIVVHRSTSLPSPSLALADAALPARRMGIFFWSFTRMNCTTSAVCRTHTHTHPSMKTHCQLCLLSAASPTFSSTCAGVSLSKPLWTCELLGWVNRESSSSSWTRLEPDCLYMKIKPGKTKAIHRAVPIRNFWRWLIVTMSFNYTHSVLYTLMNNSHFLTF